MKYCTDINHLNIILIFTQKNSFIFSFMMNKQNLRNKNKNLYFKVREHLLKKFCLFEIFTNGVTLLCHKKKTKDKI